MTFETFIRRNFPDFIFNWHHEVQCGLIDSWLIGEIKHLMILAPPRSSKTFLVSELLLVYLNEMLPKDKKVLHLTYSKSQSSRMQRTYYRNCGYNFYDSIESKVKFHALFEQFSSKFDYIISDNLNNSLVDANSNTYTNNIWKWYIYDVLTRIDSAGKQLMISSHYPNDIPSKIIAENLPGWKIAKFPLFCNITNSEYRPYNGVLWNRITTENPDELKIKAGEHGFTYLYQQEDLKNIVVY